MVEHRERQFVAGLLEAEQVARAPRTQVETDEVGEGVEGADGEDDVGSDEGAAVPPGQGPRECGAQGGDVFEADVEGLEDCVGEDGGVAGGDVEQATVVAGALQ